MAPGPHTPIVDQRLVEAWVRHAHYREEVDFWALERVNEVVQTDARTGWHLVRTIDTDDTYIAVIEKAG